MQVRSSIAGSRAFVSRHRDLVAASLATVVILAAVALHVSWSSPPSRDARAYFDRSLLLIKQRHINGASADWANILKSANYKLLGAQTAVDTYPAIRLVLDRLGEPHSFLMEPEDAMAATASTALPAVRGGAAGRDVSPPQGRLVDGRFAWLDVPPFFALGPGSQEEGEAYADRLRRTLVSLDQQPLCGWIVDLRRNTGGNMWPMLRGLDPLLGAPPFGYFVLPGGTFVAWTRANGSIVASSARDPGDSSPAFTLKHGNYPIAVLTGPKTASSGEMVLIALTGRRNVRAFGSDTAGYTTANTVHPLSDGAALVITEALVADRRKTVISESMKPNVPADDQSLVPSAIDWLDKRCAALSREAPEAVLGTRSRQSAERG